MGLALRPGRSERGSLVPDPQRIPSSRSAALGRTSVARHIITRESVSLLPTLALAHPPDRFDSLLPSLSLLFINYSSTVEARISVSRELKCQATGAKRSAKNGSKQPVVSRVFTQSCWEQKVEARGRNSPSAPCVGDRRQATRTVARMPAAGVQARQARVGQPSLETQAAHEAEGERERQAKNNDSPSGVEGEWRKNSEESLVFTPQSPVIHYISRRLSLSLFLASRLQAALLSDTGFSSVFH